MLSKCQCTRPAQEYLSISLGFSPQLKKLQTHEPVSMSPDCQLLIKHSKSYQTGVNQDVGDQKKTRPLSRSFLSLASMADSRMEMTFFKHMGSPSKEHQPPTISYIVHTVMDIHMGCYHLNSLLVATDMKKNKSRNVTRFHDQNSMSFI